MLVLAMPGVEDILLVFLVLASPTLTLVHQHQNPGSTVAVRRYLVCRYSRQCRSRALLAGGHSIRPPLRYQVEQGDLSYWVGVDARSMQS